jgi:hypothetical protein
VGRLRWALSRGGDDTRDALCDLARIDLQGPPSAASNELADFGQLPGHEIDAIARATAAQAVRRLTQELAHPEDGADTFRIAPSP